MIVSEVTKRSPAIGALVGPRMPHGGYARDGRDEAYERSATTMEFHRGTKASGLVFNPGDLH